MRHLAAHGVAVPMPLDDGARCVGQDEFVYEVLASDFWVEIRISLRRTCSGRSISALC